MAQQVSGDEFYDVDYRLELIRRVLRTDNPLELIEGLADPKRFDRGRLCAYIQSFVRLAYLGDIARVAKDAGRPAEEVARDIYELENMLACELFASVGRHSKLTSLGLQWLPRAQEIYDLLRLFNEKAGTSPLEYHSVQMPLRMVFSDPDVPRLLRRAVELWMRSARTTDCAALQEIAPYWVIYERIAGIWHSRSIGEQSAYANWFGAETTLGSEGKSVRQMAGGYDLRDEISLVLDSVHARGGVHFSEIACRLGRADGGPRQLVRYQRVLLELVDQARRPVVASVIKILDPAPRDQALG